LSETEQRLAPDPAAFARRSERHAARNAKETSPAIIGDALKERIEP
jgi:hypothetical protein